MKDFDCILLNTWSLAQKLVCGVKSKKIYERLECRATISSGDELIFSLFVLEPKIRHFMQIVSVSVI